MNRSLVPCDDHWLEDSLPVTQFAFYKCVVNLLRSARGYSPEFENGRERFWGGVLKIAGRIGVRGLDADAAGKLQNGFLD
jgi:hypothetical protein